MSNTSAQSDRYRVKVEDYTAYQRDGYIMVRNLISEAGVAALKSLADDYYTGRKLVPGTEAPTNPVTAPDYKPPVSRIHMLHRSQPVAEQFFLYPSLLDVLEALIGPDVLALQTMLFLNPPDMGGQGWHQDAFYITVYPDTLIGASVAIDAADEENGCLWVVPGSHAEPIYPSPDRPAFIHHEDSFDGLTLVENVSHLDDEVNTLSQVARKYPAAIPVPVEPGDVVFFHSHLLHRSHRNRTPDRMRRSFVCHYCNARSWVPWNHGAPFEGDAANSLHILARGWTHLPFAKPAFGTPCAALTASPEGASSMRPSRMMAVDGDMEVVPDKAGETLGIGVADR